ncbi:MAG: NAD(P)H-binding protein [Tabrizicola sp.]|uniref:NAD(P)H-binding protein n=1 Tax=Tabrizicola sp. TaxID=2005166 RepID=UPI0027373C8D|nr:NAD(P)H-binding protein [Tabrizicola sp.]MDP3261410.1 NAD(P)H-binding protein [Tabrizicola sp.]MDP3649199.1 NAD(P)H-binding protein [Paracoccaceae bacterium]MDZ4065293.1 NAD(P)H-binding protein [Tabrizicola sp.]
MTIAITGATGHLGRLAIAALKARGAAPIALARNPERAADLGVDVRAFDYLTADPAALKGVDTLVLISSSDFNDRAGQHRRVLDAAKAAGVGRIVYTSILRGEANPMILAQDHIATEAALKSSGLATTILRNGWYTENYTGALGAAVQHGAMIGAAGEGRVSSAARKDYAEAIAVAALDAAHSGKVYELAGDTAHTGADFAAAVAQAAGKPVAFVNLPAADYAAALAGFGLPKAAADIFADSDVHAGEGALYDDSHTLARLIGRPTTPIADTIAAAL